MATFTNDWDEANPTDNTYANEIDDYNVALRVDVSDRVKDMIYGFTAGENDGVQGFKELTFKQQAAAAGTPSADQIVLYSIDDGSNCGLYAKEENANAIEFIKYDGSNFGLNGDVLLPDTVDEDAIRLDNNSYLTARNAGDDGDVNLIKANADDVPEILVGAVLSADTAPASDAAVANKKYVDDQITAVEADDLVEDQVTTDSDAATLAVNHTYKATSSGIVVAYGHADGANWTLSGHTGSAADVGNHTAGSLIAREGGYSSNNSNIGCITFPVRKNEYFEVTVSNAVVDKITWTPLGNTAGECQDQD